MHTWLLVTLICLQCIAAGCAFVSWKGASRYWTLRKQLLEARLEIGELTSGLNDLVEAHKRLRSREGMRELREARRAGLAPPAEPKPPPVETKAQARARIFGPKVGPEFAKQQLEMGQQ